MKTLQVTEVSTGRSWLATEKEFRTLFERHDPAAVLEVQNMPAGKTLYFGVPGKSELDPIVQWSVRRIASPDPVSL